MQPLKLSLIFLIFHQFCFFSLCAISLRDVLSTGPKKLILYSCKNDLLKRGGLCVVGACLLYGGIRYSYNQVKHIEKSDPYAQEKTYLGIVKSFSFNVKNNIKNIFSLHKDTKKNIKQSKKIATDVERNSTTLQKKSSAIKKSMSISHDALNVSGELNEKILKHSSRIKKNSIILNKEVQDITGKKIATHKNAGVIIDLYNDQVITLLPPVDQELTAALQMCDQNIKDSQKVTNAMVDTNKKIINQLTTKTKDIKIMNKQEKKYPSLGGDKKIGIIV